MTLGQSIIKRPEPPYLNRRRRASPLNGFSIQTPFSKPQQRPPAPSGSPVVPLKFKSDTGHPQPVSAPLSSPMQAGLSNIQSELGQRGPTSFNLPKLLNPSAHYLSHDSSGNVTRSQRFQLNPQSSYMLGATDAGQVVTPHEVSLYGNAPRRMDHNWYEQWFEKGFCEKSPEQCDKLKSLKRFYDRPYEKVLAGIPLPRLAEKNEKQVIDTGERLRRFRQYYEGKYDIDEPSMSKADYMADVEKKLKQPGSGINIPTTEELLRKEYSLKMSQRAKKEDWPTGKMPIDPGLYAHTEANREAIYDHAPKDKSYGDYWDAQHQNEHWWNYLDYINATAQLYKSLKARENYASQFSDPAHDLHKKRKYLYEHPNWLKKHPEDKEKYMTGFLGNRLPKSWLGHLGTGIGNFELGLLNMASNPIGVGDSLINSLSTLPDNAKKACTAPGVDTKACVWTRRILQPLGLSSIGDVGWQSGSDLDAPIRSEPTINKALDISGQSAMAAATMILPALGAVGKAGVAAEAALGGMERTAAQGALEAGGGLERAAAEGALENAGSGLERAPLLSENTLPKTPFPEAERPPMLAEETLSQPPADLAEAPKSAPGKASPTPDQLAANEAEMRSLATWNKTLSPEQNYARQQELDRFMVDSDQLRKWQESSSYVEQQPSYFTDPRYDNAADFKTYDKDLMKQQADILLSDTAEGRAMRMNDRLAMIKNARKSPPDRTFQARDSGVAEADEMERDNIRRELMSYGKNIKSFRPNDELPKPPNYSKPSRLLDKARWKAKSKLKRVMDKGVADRMPGKGLFDDWLGPRFKADEEIGEWLAEPGAAEFYNQYRARIGVEPQSLPWAKGLQYPRVKAPRTMLEAPQTITQELETTKPPLEWESDKAKVSQVPEVPGKWPPNKHLEKQSMTAAEDITRHLQQPEETRLLAPPAARPKVPPETSQTAAQDVKPMAPVDYPDLRHEPSSLIHGDAPQGSTLKSLENMLSDNQRKIDTTHIINDASYSDSAKQRMRASGHSDALIREAEKQRIVSAVKDYEQRRSHAQQLINEIQSTTSKNKGFSLFKKKQPMPKLDSREVIEALKKIQGDAGRLLPSNRIDSHLNLNVHTAPPISRFAPGRTPIRKARPRP